MRVPSLEEAAQMMAEAERKNPGPWVRHSTFTAEAAKAIASRLPALDPSTAYILGYLHDIGRREGITGMRHVIDGYVYLMEQGFDDAARICLTHAFPLKKIYAVSGEWDCSQEDFDLANDLLSKIDYTAYDRLIQLCDAVALPTGFCLIEKRMIDVALRYGVNGYTIERWKAHLEVQKEFEQVIGQSIYQLLPGVVENTFGFNSPTRQAK